MDYLAIINRLKSVLPNDKEARVAWDYAEAGLKKEQINHMPQERAQKRFVFYIRPLFIFHLYPSVYSAGKWMKLTFNDYLRGIEKVLAKEGVA
ncbi:hypothetical protein FQS90_12355 [Enterococcus casseliflavus]|uniref:hypothetical protein n=1 Tax=Enterococcus sp. 8E11_MSG4843 TaxID=1834190 RepID=UPI000B3E8737|nr:hypothetical protein [Enterococcus sp. 8E11_MSG4843]MBO1097311.1 hypothetical protein [Enterococcus casseliflavus]MBO1144436.1 hypothetical protein [Enterococcus casseliflavus]OUZ36128.1 hypothetical protein A5885_000313 [Enterococcus sp. 8E11_MSG4843]